MGLPAARLRRNIRLIYATSFIYSFALFAPIIVLFFQQQLHSALNVAVILAIVTFGAALAEVPTGLFADTFGRKRAMVTAGVVGIAAVGTFSIAQSFPVFIVGAVLGAIATALASGADEAILYDSLKALGEENRFKHVVSRNHAMGPVSRGLASLTGGALAVTSLRTPVVATLIPFVVGFLVSLFLTEPPQSKTVVRERLSRRRQAARVIRASRQLLLLILLAFLFEGFAQSIFEFSQLFYQAKHVPIGYFGVIFAAIFTLMAFGSLAANRLSNWFGNKGTLTFTVVFTIVAVGLASYIPGWLAVPILASTAFAFGVRLPIMSQLVNWEAPSRVRATIVSFKNFAGGAGLALSAVILGMLIDTLGTPVSFALFAALLILVLPVQLFLSEGSRPGR